MIGRRTAHTKRAAKSFVEVLGRQGMEYTAEAQEFTKRKGRLHPHDGSQMRKWCNDVGELTSDWESPTTVPLGDAIAYISHVCLLEGRKRTIFPPMHGLFVTSKLPQVVGEVLRSQSRVGIVVADRKLGCLPVANYSHRAKSNPRTDLRAWRTRSGDRYFGVLNELPPRSTYPPSPSSYPE